nr:hypothetical protein Iba_chr07bCG7410 [Ipomoea batatas]
MELGDSFKDIATRSSDRPKVVVEGKPKKTRTGVPIPSLALTTLPDYSIALPCAPARGYEGMVYQQGRRERMLGYANDPYDILDSIDISDLPMDDNTPLGELPHPSAEVSPLHGDPLDVAPLQTLEPESSFSFDPPTVFTELELDIPRSI